MATPREWLDELGDEFLIADGFDDAIIGVTHYQPTRPSLVVYDAEKCVEILMRRDRMSREDAWEFFDYNVVGGWHGENTPVFMSGPGCYGG